MFSNPADIEREESEVTSGLSAFPVHMNVFIPAYYDFRVGRKSLLAL